MDEKHRIALALYLAGWLDKMSVACFAVGLFQPKHIFGGIIGGVIFLLIGIAIKARIGQ